MNTTQKERCTFAIISHPDAGKTTITEKLLWFGGVIREMGMVKSKSDNFAKSDWMELEKQRGSKEWRVCRKILLGITSLIAGLGLLIKSIYSKITINRWSPFNDKTRSHAFLNDAVKSGTKLAANSSQPSTPVAAALGRFGILSALRSPTLGQILNELTDRDKNIMQLL